MFNPRGDRLQVDISDRIEKEVDRSYNRFFTQFNFAIFLIGTSVWILRQSVMNNLQTDFKRQFKEELEEDFKKELDKLKDDLAAQRRKDEIIQELSILIPRPDLFFQEQVKPDAQVALKRLTAELEQLKADNLSLCLTVEDHIKWGDALYYSAWNSKPRFDSISSSQKSSVKTSSNEQTSEYYEKAIKHYEEAIRLQRDSYKAHLGMGNALTMSRQYKEAIKFYEKASEDRNISHIAWVSKGFALRRLHNGKIGLMDGLACLDEAIKIFPMYARAYYNQACYYARLDELDEAVSSFEKALEYAPAQCIEVAEEDSDFCSIKDQEKFKEWVPNYQACCVKQQ